MKILRLTGSMPHMWGIDLHPRLTVIHGLAPELALAVRDAIDAVVQARISGPELAAAGLSGVARLGDTDVDLEDLADRVAGLVPSTPLSGSRLLSPAVVLSSDRRRAAEAALAAAERDLAAAESDLVEARREWELAREARTTRIRAGWFDRSEAVETLREARARVADARAGASEEPSPPRPLAAVDAEVARLAEARVDATRRARDAAAAAVAEARQLVAGHTGRAPVGADLDSLRAELDQAEAACAAPEPPVVTEEQRRALIDQRATLLSNAAQLDARSTERVSAALAEAEAHGGIAAVEAARVAVEWERVKELVDAAEPAPEPRSPLFGAAVEAPPTSLFGAGDAAGPPPELVAKVRDARERAAAARRALADAAGATPLDAGDVEALEAAHAEVLAAWEGSERRIGVGKARRRLEEAQLAEREILARMGFASYTEFMVSGRGSGLPPQIDPEQARREVMFAEEALSSAERELEAATAAAAPSPATEPPPAETGASRGHLVETLAALRARAAELLGEDPGEEVASRLRDRIATDPLSDLRLALDEVGVPLGEVLTRDEVLTRARMWLARQQDTTQQAASLAARRAQVEDALARLDAAEGARVAWEAARRRRDQIRAAIAEAEAAVAAATDPAERLARDEADLARAEAELTEAERDLASLQDHPSDHRRPSAPAALDLSELEAQARDAQTALDVAVAHLLPTGAEPEIEADARLARAESRVAMARLELDSARALATRRDPAAPGSSEIDVDAISWQILARMAAQQVAARPDGPGPAPLLIDEPFAGLAEAEIRRVASAIAGPASAVQTIIMTTRPEAVAWARATDPELVGVVTSAAPVGSSVG